MAQSEWRRVLLIATVTALCGTALIAILSLVTGSFDDTQLRVLATTGGFGLMSLIASRGTPLLEHDRHRTLGWAVILASALTFVALFLALWTAPDEEAAWKAFVCLLAVAGALGQIAGMLARRRASDPESIHLLNVAASILAVVLAAMTWNAALSEVEELAYYQLFGALAVLNVLALALQPVVRRLGTPSRDAPGGSFVLVLSDGRRLEHRVTNDLPAEVANSLRRHGDQVERIELGHG